MTHNGEGRATKSHLGVKGLRLPHAELQDVWHLVNGSSHKDACYVHPLKHPSEGKRVLYASVHRVPFFIASFNQHCAKAQGCELRSQTFHPFVSAQDVFSRPITAGSQAMEGNKTVSWVPLYSGQP